MQSLQPSGAKDLSSYLENPRSPERSPERPFKLPLDLDIKSLEKESSKPGTPTPTSRDISRDAPSLRPSSRPGLKAILGDTPQSATMRALQSTPTNNENEPLSNISNNSNALVRSPQNMDAISNQILGLTSICTRLQQEMAALSRRSKDNATDLVSLREATCSRDEDIRTSLKDLVSNITLKAAMETDRRPLYGRSQSNFVDEKSASPLMAKSISLPRIPSPASFSATLDREIAASPNPYSVDGAAAIALLEKILREMGTKEGQEKLLSIASDMTNELSEVSKTPKENPESRISKQLVEVIGLLKEQSTSRALVRTDGARPSPFIENLRPVPISGNSQSMTQLNTGAQDKPYSSPRAADFVSEDILKLLKRIKDSVAEGGGMSAEIKALVRELRGEVLGMGREIGRKLDQAESTQNANPRGDAHGPGREEISQIVEQGLIDLREHMNRVMQEHRRQSSASAISRSTVDSQEVYTAVKNALSEMPIPQAEIVNQGSGIEREEILEAVREAWETYKPEIELTTHGLERDEILQCLKEGMEEYRPKSEQQSPAVYDEVLDAVKDGLKDFKPPAPETEASITREEILMAVRECLESFDFPTASRDRDHEVTREDVVEAVREGLSSQPALSKEIEFNREDLFEAVRLGLEGAPTPMAGVGEQVLDKMQDLIEGMKGEFQQYSAANGRDTEQVLDAMKDGLEVLRASIEGYVDRASDVTGKDEIVDTVRGGLDNLRIDLEASIANTPRPAATGSADLLDAMEREFEHLRSTISSSVTRSEASSAGREEILDAIRDAFDDLKEGVPQGGSGDISVVKEELQHLRETLATSITRGGGDGIDREEMLEAIKDGFDKASLGLSKDNGRPESILSNTSELIDHFNEGLENLKTDVERIVNKPIDMTVNYEILDTLKEGLASVRASLDEMKIQQAEIESTGSKRGGEVVIADEEMVRGLQKPDIENLEVMITQLKIKVESLDDRPPPPPASTVPEDSVVKTDFERLELMMKEVQDAVASLMVREQVQQDNTVTKEDTDAIETLLRNTKAQIEDLPLPDLETIARTEHFEILETMLKNTKDAVEDLNAKQDSDSVTKEEVAGLDLVLKDVHASVQEIKDKWAEENTTKADFEALAAICTEHRDQFKEIVPEALPSKEEFEGLRDLVHEFQEKFETDAEMTAQAFDARKTEHGGLADKIEDVKAFLELVRKELKETLDGSGTGIQDLATSLSAIGEAITAANASATTSELKDILDHEFEKAHANHEESKTEFEQHRETLFNKHDEHKQAVIEDLTAKIDARFDELMTKYDDAQAAADGKASAFEDQAKEQAESVASARAVTDDLKLLVDTLGSTVADSCERVSEDSRTVFTKVEEIEGKVDEAMQYLTIDTKADHQLTRAEVSKTLVAVENLQAHSAEFNPKLMTAINEVLSIVGQHFEEAQKSSEEIKSSVKDIPNIIPVPALPAPQEPVVVERQALPEEKYDDTEVHSKLDRLVEWAAEAGKSAVQFEMLEEIKNQITNTASEFQTFMNAQQATIMNMQETRNHEAEEAGIALEKRTAQKEIVEADIVRLSEERSNVESSVADIKQQQEEMRREKEQIQHERDELASLKARLQADVSSLEMALQIRREEMQIMEERAEGLERRIIEGVLDHSRSLLLSSRPKSSLHSMNLKRVPSNASSNATVTTEASSVKGSVPPSAVSSAVGMAMKKRQPPTNGHGSPASANRRILSLSTIGANKGHATEKSMAIVNTSNIAAKANGAFGGGLKRSHSVKSNFPSRKTSWGGTKQIGMFGDDPVEEDKENSMLEEEEEGSLSGTDRRTSYTGTYTGTEESYGTESVTDSNDDRRTSYAASTVGTVAGMLPNEGESASSSKSGHAEGRQAELEHGQLQLYQGDQVQAVDFGDGTKEVVVYGLPSDSGIGTDLPTVALSADGNFFDQR